MIFRDGMQQSTITVHEFPSGRCVSLVLFAQDINGLLDMPPDTLRDWLHDKAARMRPLKMEGEG